MADYVLLEGSDKNNRIRVIVHSDVPAGNNAVGVAWSDALVGFLSDTVSVVPVSLLPPGRQAELDAGTKYEWSLSFEDDANESPVTRLANIEAAVAVGEADQIAELSNRLRYWGKVGTV